MPDRPATRLHVDAPLTAGGRVALSPAQAHRLRAVLRLAAGDAVALFNAGDGEWLARIAAMAHAHGSVEIEVRLRPPGGEGDLWLVFAPVKRLELLVEKATELGASALVPVITAHTQIARLNPARLAATAAAAAEQSERLSVPEIRAAQPLARLVDAWPSGRRLIWCDESGTAPPIAATLAALAPGPMALLVGPEGGFAETELDALRKLPFVSPVSLGPRVLRSETAALAGLAVVQALAGDWARARDRRLSLAANVSP
jgi:16S rRNA (uracil1498-N3)-methyltransferase